MTWQALIPPPPNYGLYAPRTVQRFLSSRYIDSRRIFNSTMCLRVVPLHACSPASGPPRALPLGFRQGSHRSGGDAAVRSSRRPAYRKGGRQRGVCRQEDRRPSGMSQALVSGPRAARIMNGPIQLEGELALEDEKMASVPYRMVAAFAVERMDIPCRRPPSWWPARTAVSATTTAGFALPVQHMPPSFCCENVPVYRYYPCMRYKCFFWREVDNSATQPASATNERRVIRTESITRTYGAPSLWGRRSN